MAAMATAVLLALSGCGGGGGDGDGDATGPDEQVVIDNFAETYAAGNGGALTSEETDCFAQGFVKAAGVEKLREIGLIDDEGTMTQSDVEFDAAAANDLADAFLACVDFTARQAEEVGSSDPAIDVAALSACLSERISTDEVRELIISAYTEPSNEALKLQRAYTKKLDACTEKATTEGGKAESAQ